MLGFFLMVAAVHKPLVQESEFNIVCSIEPAIVCQRLSSRYQCNPTVFCYRKERLSLVANTVKKADVFVLLQVTVVDTCPEPQQATPVTGL